MKKLLFVFLFILSIFSSRSQKLTSSGNEFRFTSSNKELKIDFCTPSMFRVTTSWNKQFEENENWMVTRYNWQPVAVKSSEHNGFYRLQTNDLVIKVDKATFQITVSDRDGKLLSSENIQGGGTGKKW